MKNSRMFQQHNTKSANSMLDCSGSKLPEGGMTAGDLSATSLHDSPAGGEASVTGSLLASASTLWFSTLG
jgi:hypothetical protein